MYSSAIVEEAVVRLLREAECMLPADVRAALSAALENEPEMLPRSQLEVVLRNAAMAAELTVPMCQDTGLPVLFVRGRYDPRLERAIRQGVARATEEVPLRPNTVDPVSRANHGDNLGPGMPPVHFEPSDARHLDLAVLPKGAGSENWSALRMLNPAEGMEGVRRFVLECVVRAGPRPCPPTVVGVGIGGTADQAALLSKRALLRDLGSRNGDGALAALETSLLTDLNSLGLGPMGLGGRTTCLDVLIEKASCHTASLPVAVSLSCWALRRAFARVRPDGTVSFRQEGGW
ncbi:MAG TPA: fumarate hydratase [Methanomassiliicoccales archaeon]|nr:fumarate hydratase [Methanomassiliicoccales archaeon]